MAMNGLESLLATEAIRTLKARYFRLMDQRDFAAMADVFCVNARFDCSAGSLLHTLNGGRSGGSGPVVQGRTEIIAWVGDALMDVPTVHHGHCHEVMFDSDTEAHGIIAMEDYLLTPDRQTILLHGAGHYHEQYRVEDGAWRIAETKLIRLFRKSAREGGR
jgi:hypothetical protein